MKKFLLIVISILLVAPTPARAADRSPEADTEHAVSAVPPETPLHLDLDEVLEKILEANPGLQALSRRQAAAEKQASAAGKKRWGNLDAFFNYVQNNDDLLIRPMSWQMISGADTIEDLLLAQARRQAAVAALARARGTVLTAAETINTIVEKEALK